MASKRDLTDAQWDVYAEGLEGGQVEGWQGQIRQVGDKSFLAGGYPIHIEIVRDCDIYYVVKDEDVALQFTKGQNVIVSGEIDFVSVFLWNITLHMVDEAVRVE